MNDVYAMQPLQSKLFDEHDAAEVCVACELEPEAHALLEPGMLAGAFYEALLGADRPLDAIRVLAPVLPSRDAVWWSWHCAVEAAGESPPPKVLEALSAVSGWLAEPSDEQRRASGAQAQEAGMATPAGCTAMAAFLAEGSMGPAEIDVVEPPEGVCGKLAAGAVIMACVQQEPPQDAPERAVACLEVWWQMAASPRPWGSAGSAPDRVAPESEYDSNLKLD